MSENGWQQTLLTLPPGLELLQLDDVDIGQSKIKFPKSLTSVILETVGMPKDNWIETLSTIPLNDILVLKTCLDEVYCMKQSEDCFVMSVYSITNYGVSRLCNLVKLTQSCKTKEGQPSFTNEMNEILRHTDRFKVERQHIDEYLSVAFCKHKI